MSQHAELLRQFEADLGIDSSVSNSIPKTSKLRDTPRVITASQELQNLAQTVFLSGEPGAPHAIVFCSVEDESSTSDICLQLGRIIASSSAQPVCLIDADVRSLRLSNILNGSPHLGACTTGDKNPEQVEKGLWLTSLDPMRSSRGDCPLPADQFRRHLDRLRKQFEFILVDAPGLNGRIDAAVLSQIADGAILVIEANSTRKGVALKAKRALESMNVRILGCVLNNRTFPIPEKLYRKL